MKRQIVYLINQDWYFLLHWQERAQEAVKRGYNVTVLVPKGDRVDAIREKGFRVEEIRLSRRSLNPIIEMVTFIKLLFLIKKLNPHLLVNITLKNCLYGSIIGNALKIPTVNNIAGLGSLFINKGFKIALYRTIVCYLFKINKTSAKNYFLFENNSDRDFFIQKKIVNREQTDQIPGSGIDPIVFDFQPEPNSDVIKILFASRLLWNKGVLELTRASEMLSKRSLCFDIIVAGIWDNGNPSVIPLKQIKKWHKSGLIHWIGQINDMPSLIAASHIVVLPSYREGLPRILLEAASSGRPIVTTDTIGCRDVVTHRKNGLLVPVKDCIELADALEELIRNAELRASLGKSGRKKVLARYTNDIVFEKTFKVYSQLLKETKSLGQPM